MNLFNIQGFKLKIAGSSSLEVDVILEEKLSLINQWKEERFLPLTVKSIVKQAEDEVGLSAIDINKFYVEVEEVYETYHSYLQTWKIPLNEFSVCKWMLLSSVPAWFEVGENVKFLQDTGQSTSDSL